MSQSRDPNKVYLSAIRDGDHFRIVDQDGRTVAGVRSINIDVNVGDAASFTATVLDAPIETEATAHTGAAKR